MRAQYLVIEDWQRLQIGYVNISSTGRGDTTLSTSHSLGRCEKGDNKKARERSLTS